jgi:hypothetical protein
MILTPNSNMYIDTVLTGIESVATEKKLSTTSELAVG